MVAAELPLRPSDTFGRLFSGFTRGDRTFEIGDGAGAVAAHALQSRSPAVGVQALFPLNHILVGLFGFLIGAGFHQRITQDAVRIPVCDIHLDGFAGVQRRCFELVTGIKDVREMAHRAGVVGIDVQRLLQRLFGATEITRIAGLARLSDQRIAQARDRPGSFAGSVATAAGNKPCDCR